jgi:polyhydroxybutyrate depolymerase
MASIVNPVRLLFCAILALTVAGVSGAGSQDVSVSLHVGGQSRTYLLYVPTSPAGRVPLIIAFHGHGGSGMWQRAVSGFDSLSDRYGFIVAYPDGIRRGWNDGRTTADVNGADDLGFIRALIADLESRYSIDPKRIYATGMSNGATFSQYLACNEGSLIAAIAPVSGSMPTSIVASCHPARPISVLEIGGTADPLMPYRGGAITFFGRTHGDVLSVDRSVAFWAQNAGCGPSPVTTPLPAIAPPDGTTIVRSTYSGCRAGTGVVQYEVIGGEHAWPGGNRNVPKVIPAKMSAQLNASETIVQFFLAHPMQ